MNKGSLWDIIHNPTVKLSWQQVSKICRDVAAGSLTLFALFAHPMSRF